MNKFILTTLMALNFGCFNLQATAINEFRKITMLNDVETIKKLLEVGYAPSSWKQNHANWDLNKAVDYAKERIQKSENLSDKEFKHIVKELVNSTRDYHVDAYFYSTENSTLPFTVKGAEGRYFIDAVDNKVLSFSQFHIAPGDELLEMDGKPIGIIIDELKEELSSKGNPCTEQSYAELYLTNRPGSMGISVPQGSTNIVIKSLKMKCLFRYQMMWDYYPEQVQVPNSLSNQSENGMEYEDLALSKKVMKMDLFLLAHSFPHEKFKTQKPILGTTKTFLPRLSDHVRKLHDSEFDTYIYPLDKYNIGSIRIKDFHGTKEKVKQFEEIITILQKDADALVINLLNNPGGSVDYTYDLLSMLTDYPLITPKHRIYITQEDVYNALCMLSYLNISSDKEAVEELSISSYQRVLFWKEYYRFIINEWNAGRFLTSPTYLVGVDQINPHPIYRFTKPIIVLINELDFSGGDFFPAILQDNKRAVLFGNRTAGAGGAVKLFSFPNLNAIMGISYTHTIALRTNGQPIEDLGVTPDVPYKITVKDLETRYEPYANAVNQAMLSILKSQNK